MDILFYSVLVPVSSCKDTKNKWDTQISWGVLFPRRARKFPFKENKLSLKRK